MLCITIVVVVVVVVISKQQQQQSQSKLINLGQLNGFTVAGYRSKSASFGSCSDSKVSDYTKPMSQLAAAAWL